MKKVLIFLLVLIISITPVISYAETYEIPEEVLDYNYHVAVISRNGKYYRIYCFNEPDQVRVRIDEDGTIYSYWNNKTNGYVYEKNLTNGVWSEGLASYYLYEGELIISEIIGSNIDVYTREGTVFFSPPAPPVLLETMEGVHSGMILKTILAGLTPLLGCLILAISLRKGLGFLKNQLMH